jgi:DNA-directed RNA polymerase subunit RPC12/RpoP
MHFVEIRCSECGDKNLSIEEDGTRTCGSCDFIEKPTDIDKIP